MQYLIDKKIKQQNIINAGQHGFTETWLVKQTLFHFDERLKIFNMLYSTSSIVFHLLLSHSYNTTEFQPL